MTELSPFQHTAVPACAVDQFGRIIYWNNHAADLLGRASTAVLGREWHSVIRSVRTPGCCALCEARRSLRNGGSVQPSDAVLLIESSNVSVTLVPLAFGAGWESTIAFLMIRRDPVIEDSATNAPIPLRSRTPKSDEDRIIDELTRREREILDCIVRGLDARAIAACLGITHATSRNYVQRILNKLGARNKAEAVNIALTYDLLAS